MNIAKDIRDKIAECVATSRSLRRQLETASAEQCPWLCSCKRRMGNQTRAWLLAYAMWRGVPYVAVEPRCREGNEPISARVLDCLALVLPRDGAESEAWTRGRVEAWLLRPNASDTAQVAA